MNNKPSDYGVHKAHCFMVVQPENEFMGCKYGADKATDLEMTWHIHDSDVPMFDHLRYENDYWWDGHDTEEKYRRLRKLILERKQ